MSSSVVEAMPGLKMFRFPRTSSPLPWQTAAGSAYLWRGSCVFFMLHRLNVRIGSFSGTGKVFTGLKSMKISAWLGFCGERQLPRHVARKLAPNTALHRTPAVAPPSQLSRKTFGA